MTNETEFHGVFVQEYVVVVDVTNYGDKEEEMHGLGENNNRLIGMPYADAVSLAEKVGGRVVAFGPMREIGE